MGVPECRDIAFLNEDKFFTCPLSSSNVTECEGYTASNTQSKGGTIEWCIRTGSRTTYCVNSDNFTAALSPELPLLNISGMGMLHISPVTVALRTVISTDTGAKANNNVVNCSIFNREYQLCGTARLEVVIPIIGKAHVAATVLVLSPS